MSSKSIKVVCEEKCLNIIYSPAINFDVIEQNINDGTWIKGDCKAGVITRHRIMIREVQVR